MKLPNARQARVQSEKITGYLLSEDPSVGGGKPNFFIRFGFRPDNWREFADALLAVGREYDVVDILETPFGIKYVIEGQIATPDGRNPQVKTVWQIDWGKDYPRLVSAYPKPRGVRRQNVRGI